MDVMSKRKDTKGASLRLEPFHFIRIYPYYHYPFVMSVNTYYKAESSIYTRLLVHKDKRFEIDIEVTPHPYNN